MATVSELIKNNRIRYIDIAKGIAIILIVIGHVYPLNGNVSIAVHYVSLPLFFMVSGFLFNFDKYENNFKALIKNSFIQLILPALIFSLVIMRDFTVFFSSSDFMSFLWACGVDAGKFHILRTHMGATWFLYCLFLARILLWCFLKFIKYSKINQILVFILVYTIAQIGASLGMMDFYLPWSADISLVALFFMYAGYFLHQKRFFETNSKTQIISLFFALILACLYLKYTMMFNLNMRIYGNFFVTLIGASALSVLVMYLSVYIDKLQICKHISNILQYLGINSLIIYLYHNLFIPVDNLLINVILQILFCCVAIECFAYLKNILRPHSFLEDKK